MDADDFLYNPEVQADRFRSVTNGIAKIEVLGEKVVEIQFKERRFDNKQQAALMPVLPKHFFSRFTPAQINTSTGLLMGSGPYRFPSVDPDNQWAPPQDIVLVRNESYWARARRWNASASRWCRIRSRASRRSRISRRLCPAHRGTV